jgi:hypothetical protein
MRPPDDDILALRCEDKRPYSITVDDYDDPNEEEVTDDQIHVTVWRGMVPGADGECDYCLKLSTVSARRLVAELEAAIRQREQ